MSIFTKALMAVALTGSIGAAIAQSGPTPQSAADAQKEKAAVARQEAADKSGKAGKATKEAASASGKAAAETGKAAKESAKEAVKK